MVDTMVFVRSEDVLLISMQLFPDFLLENLEPELGLLAHLWLHIFEV